MSRYELLDHGYLEVVNAWGSEEQIIEAARMSTGKGFKGWGPRCVHCGTEERICGPDAWGCITRGLGENLPHDFQPGDEKLLRYLYEHQHMTPFEMAGMTIEVQAPIFVFREWHRHRVPFGYNEASARYAPLPDVNYIPTVDRLMVRGGDHLQNKQAQGTGESLHENNAGRFRAQLSVLYTQAQELYENALEAGVPKELARICLPVGRYSKMRATGNLRGWLNFIKLRLAPNAQFEIRMYADALWNELHKVFPRTLDLFDEEQDKSRVE